jgi:hypothetical protein
MISFLCADEMGILAEHIVLVGKFCFVVEFSYLVVLVVGGYRRRIHKRTRVLKNISPVRIIYDIAHVFCVVYCIGDPMMRIERNTRCVVSLYQA